MLLFSGWAKQTGSMEPENATKKAEANIQRKCLKRDKVNIKSFLGLEVKIVIRGHVETLIIYLRTFVNQTELPSCKNKTAFEPYAG